MKRNPFYARLSTLALAAVLTSVAASAQGYYDDDIYFDPSKAKKEQPAQKTQAAQQQPAQQLPSQYYYDGAGDVPWTGVGDYQAAGTYTPAGGSTRDVDEYNRHYSGSDLPTDSISLQQFEDMSASMANTRNLARFHNSEAAREAEADGYYADGQEYYNQGYNAGYNAGLSNSSTTVNLTVGSYWPYTYSSWRWPYYSPWGWSSWYNPYYSWTWAPSWDWGWGWCPSWSWGWGPSWSWGPSWGWGPSWAWAPPRYYNNPPGATRPNRPRNNGSYANRPGAWGGGTRGSIASSNGRRPGYNSSGAGTTTSRPGYSAPIGRPSTAGSSTGTYNRGRAGYTTTPSGTSGSRGTYSTPSNNSNSRPSYNNNSGSYSRGRSSSSSGGFSSGRSSGGFSGGGATRSNGGGGGGRGRR